MNEQNLPRFPAGKKELRFGACLLVCGIFLWNCILFSGFYLGFALGTIAAILISTRYFLTCGYRFDGYSGALLILSLLIAAGFAWSPDQLKSWMLLMLIFSVNLSFCLVTGRNRRNPGSAASVLDAPRVVFSFGLAGLSPALRGLNDARKNAGTFGKNTAAAALGLLLAVPVVAAMMNLLMRADAAFEGLIRLLPQVRWTEPVWSAVFGTFFGWVLYARGTGLKYREEPAHREKPHFKVSSITVNILLFAVNALYLAYLVSQLAYMGGGFLGILPEGYTLAQYARRGFFEMAWLGGINLALMCAAMGLTDVPSRLTKGFCLFLAGITLFLIATASAKMLLYIRSYGLTRLRVTTEIFMVWLAVTTVLVSVRLFCRRFSYMKGVVLAALILATLTFWMDVDARIAQYNVQAYQSGRLETVDMDHLSSLGYGAYPYIRELVEDEDPRIAGKAARLLRNRHCRIEDLRDWNYAEAKAENIAAAFSAPAEAP